MSGNTMSKRNGPIRVLVVEDSPTARNLLVALFNECSDIQVVGTALDGVEAVQRALELRPDLITMDIHLPRINGLEATRRILRLAPIPIVVVTASLNQPDMDLTFEALRVGALSVVKKPGRNDAESCATVVRTVRLMADVPVVHRWNHSGNTAQLVLPKSVQPVPFDTGQEKAPPKKPARIVGIASSTGGPGALANALRTLPGDYPLPILIVQHITRGFAASLAEWLSSELKLRVRLAEQSELPGPGTVLISPDDCHMQVGDHGEINLHNSPPYKGLRPSADYLFLSLARVYGQQAVGVILTGMGEDGVEGLTELHRQGGVVLAQDEATSVVYGMPREAARRKVVDYILPVNEVGPALLRLSRKVE
jgi:two-component system chemotaxis response regulator CheB